MNHYIPWKEGVNMMLIMFNYVHKMYTPVTISQTTLSLPRFTDILLLSTNENELLLFYFNFKYCVQ